MNRGRAQLISWQIVGVRRRVLAAVLTFAAVMLGLGAVRPSPASTVAVWSAGKDLTGGTALHSRDVRLVHLPRADVPAGALTASTHVTGRLVAAPMRRGEPFTDVRLLDPSLLAAVTSPTGEPLVAVPIRVSDGAATQALARAGERIDVIAATDSTDGSTARAVTVATSVVVLATPTIAGDGAGSGADDGVLVLAATAAQAAALASAEASARLSIAVQR